MFGPRLISAFGLVILCQLSAILGGDVPVFMFGDEKVASENPVNPLSTMSQQEFGTVLTRKVGVSQAPIAVFIKDSLCIEDVSRQSLSLDDASWLEYFASVESPVSAFNNLESYNVTVNEEPDKISDGQIVNIPINDLSSIAEMYATLQATSPNLVGALTGKNCGWNRSERTRRAVSARDDNENNITIYQNNILFYAPEGIYLKPADNESFTLLGQPISETVQVGSDYFQLDLGFTYDSANVTLILNFTTLSAGYWNFTSLDYVNSTTTVALLRTDPIFFPKNFSYHCSLDTVFSADAVYVNITKIQVQWYPAESNGIPVFSDTYDCVGFTTVPIWSAILVTATLGLILIWGLTMILDIRTMDRFDDPKGKTITVANTE